MRFHALIPLTTAALLACEGSFNQGADLGTDTGDATDGGGEDGGMDGGSSDGGGDGGSGDGGSDGGGDDGGTDDTCKNMFHPIHETGWSKEFTLSYAGSTGTATETGLGPSTNDAGVEIYSFTDTLVTGGNEYDVVVDVACDYDGEGMFILNWGGDFTYMVFDIIPMPGSIDGQITPHRKYLPPEYAVGASGNWDYSYTTNIAMLMADTGSPQPSSIVVTGTYSELGTVDYMLPDGTSVEAYKLVNAYQTSGDFLGSPLPANGYIEQLWVKGIGLVYETNSNSDDGSVLIERELTSYTGLSVVQ